MWWGRLGNMGWDVGGVGWGNDKLGGDGWESQVRIGGRNGVSGVGVLLLGCGVG